MSNGPMKVTVLIYPLTCKCGFTLYQRGHTPLCSKQVEVVSRITVLRRLGRFGPAAGAAAVVHNKAHQQHRLQRRESTGTSESLRGGDCKSQELRGDGHVMNDAVLMERVCRRRKVSGMR